MLETVKDRLIYFLNQIGMSKSEFGRRIGVSSAFVTSMRKSIQPDKVRAIQKEFPHLNPHWLLFGEGRMLTAESNSVFLGPVQKIPSEDLVQVRFFEVTPLATFQEFCSNASEDPAYIGIKPDPGERLDDSFCAFRVHGESMAPQIQPGALVLCQEIPPTRWHTLSGVVAIAYADRFVIKRIADNSLACGSSITLASDNPDYPGRETVALADIRAIFSAHRIISSKIH